jgi:hypothetical protein
LEREHTRVVRRKPSPKHGAMQAGARHTLKYLYFQDYRAFLRGAHVTH